MDRFGESACSKVTLPRPLVSSRPLRLQHDDDAFTSLFARLGSSQQSFARHSRRTEGAKAQGAWLDQIEAEGFGEDEKGLRTIEFVE